MDTGKWKRGVVLALLAVACGHGEQGVEPGFETGPCVDGSCLGGLVCLSDICVVPTPGDTTDVSGSEIGEVTSGQSAEGSTSTSTTTAEETTPVDGTVTSNASSESNAETNPPAESSSSETGAACGGAGIAPGDACNPFTQNCQECYKCNPWADDGGNSWNADMCVEIDADPREIGETCTVVDSGTSGIDDCVLGAFCWGVDIDTDMGHCIELCSGTPAAPVCTTMDTVCVVSNSGTLPICLPTCDPLAPVCGPGEGCYPHNSVDVFFCATDASGVNGQYLDQCSYVNVCDPGLACLSPARVPNCVSMPGCCSPYCDLNAANSCPDGLPCTPWFDAGMAPPGLDDVGACAEPA